MIRDLLNRESASYRTNECNDSITYALLEENLLTVADAGNWISRSGSWFWTGGDVLLGNI